VTAPTPFSPLRHAITTAWTCDEAEHVRALLDTARQPCPDWNDTDRAAIHRTATDLVRRVRARTQDQGAIEAFMQQYDLGSEEGVLLMCVAEALLRIPDQDTADLLIRDKLGEADWKKHLGQSDSVLVNASTWGLMLTGQLVELHDVTKGNVYAAFKRLIGRVGEPVIRLAVRQAMRIMGHQFVMGRTINEALARSRKGENASRFRSNSRPCTRVTNTPSRGASWPNSPRAFWTSPAARRATASASPSMPKKPTGWNSRST